MADQNPAGNHPQYPPSLSQLPPLQYTQFQPATAIPMANDQNVAGNHPQYPPPTAIPMADDQNAAGNHSQFPPAIPMTNDQNAAGNHQHYPPATGPTLFFNQPGIPPSISQFPHPQYPVFPPLFSAEPPPLERRITYFFFYLENNSSVNIPLQTLIIYTASDNPCVPQFLNNQLDYLYVPSAHALFPYLPSTPPLHNPNSTTVITVPWGTHFLPAFGPLHLMGENPPLLPTYLHRRPRGPTQNLVPHLLPPVNNPGYPRNLVPGQTVFFLFMNGVVICSTTDNPWNNPLVVGSLDFDHKPVINALIPRLRTHRQAHPRYHLPPYLDYIQPDSLIQLLNVPLRQNNLSGSKRKRDG